MTPTGCIDRQIMDELERRTIDLDLAEPAAVRYPPHVLVAPEIEQQVLRRPFISEQIHVVFRGGGGKQRWLLVRQQVDIGLDDIGWRAAQAKDSQRYPWIGHRHRDIDRGPVTDRRVLGGRR